MAYHHWTEQDHELVRALYVQHHSNFEVMRLHMPHHPTVAALEQRWKHLMALDARNAYQAKWAQMPIQNQQQQLQFRPQQQTQFRPQQPPQFRSPPTCPSPIPSTVYGTHPSLMAA